MTISDFASIVLAISGTFSLIYISRQVSVTRQQTKGQFLLSLDEQFTRSREILIKFNGNPNYQPEGEDWPRVWALMSVFERINIMVADKILDIDIVERLHGYVLFGLIANDAVYHRLLGTGAEWQDFIDLCRTIAKLRRGKAVGPHYASFIERVQALDKDSRTLTDPWKY
jgi:hypothetical protein